MTRRALVPVLLASLCMAALSPRTAGAQVELGPVLQSLAQSGKGLPRAILRAPRARVPVLAEYTTAEGDAALVAGRYRPRWLLPDELTAFAQDHPTTRLHWAPPRYPLLDRAARWIGAASFRAETGLTGRGVIVGVVDTGLDVSHADLRTSDGKSRVRYLIDYSRPAAGLQPALEDEYGCTGDAECAIYSNEDLDALLDNGVAGDEPRDTFGHGTHVASLAAGNGRSMKSQRYLGMAPEAWLFGARVSRAGDGAIYDADIISATRFIFEQAEALGMPAVVNLSLGSDFGTHDGTSPLELALASFVGPQYPGRAIVVAAGNSGGLYGNLGSGEPEPLGIHTEVHVPRESPVEIPLLTPSENLGAVRGATIYVWLGFRPGDELSVAVDRNTDSWIPAVPPGASTTYDAPGFEGTVFNGPTREGSSIRVGSHNAVVVIDGDYEPGEVFVLRLSGHGTVNVWVQSAGGAAPEISPGVLVPRGEKQGTINIPASHPDLIAVGASVNRNRWIDSSGQSFLVADEAAGDRLAEVDGTAVFSAAGPNALGVIKPDLVAPGMYVIGAMSTDADPRNNGGLGVFASQGRCGEPDYECFVTDDRKHAVTSGTSMSAPLVAGAIALLLERRPELTQPQLRTLLQAGARRLTGTVLAEQQVGPGALDLTGTLAVLVAEDSPLEREPGAASRIVVAAPFIHPDPTQPLRGLLELRDSQDLVADGFDERRLALVARGGSLSQPPTRLGPGLYAFEVVAPHDSGGKSLTLELSFDGAPLARRSLPIGTDRWIAEGTPVPRGGSCNLTPVAPRDVSWLAVALLALALRRRAFSRRGPERSICERSRPEPTLSIHEPATEHVSSSRSHERWARPRADALRLRQHQTVSDGSYAQRRWSRSAAWGHRSRWLRRGLRRVIRYRRLLRYRWRLHGACR